MAVDMGAWRFGVGVWVAVGLWAMAAAAGAHAVSPEPDFQGLAAPLAVKALARWAFSAGDAGGQPFAVVDKRNARLFVFGADGRIVGSTPVLLGQARGDASAPGVGSRVLAGIPAQERTTPAGRFTSHPGHNHQGEAIVWVDYEAAVAIHRLRPSPAQARRAQRLASESADDRRVSLGCIVVSEAFYDGVVAPQLGRRRGVVYVLPETREWTAVFAAAAGV
jgi:hypothetical protein